MATTLLEWAIASNWTIEKTLRAFRAKQLPPEVGCLDPERDISQASYAVRQGVSLGQLKTAGIFAHWPFDDGGPPKWKPTDQGIRVPWWQDPLGIEAVALRQNIIRANIDNLQVSIQNEAKVLREDFRRANVRIRSLYGHVRHLKILQQQVERLTREAMDAVESGKVILAHAGTIEQLREKLFTPAFVDREIALRLREQRRQRKRELKMKRKLEAKHAVGASA